MANLKVKEPKRLCRCGCGKILSARAERRHRDGQLPPRLAAIQSSRKSVCAATATTTTGNTPTVHITPTCLASTSAHQHDVSSTSRCSRHDKHSRHEQEDISMDVNSNRGASPLAMDIQPDHVTIEPAAAAVTNARRLF